MDQKIRELERQAKIGTQADKDAYHLALLRSGQTVPSKKDKEAWYDLGYRVVVATYNPNPNDPYEFHYCYRAQFKYSWKCNHNHKAGEKGVVVGFAGKFLVEMPIEDLTLVGNRRYVVIDVDEEDLEVQ